MGDVVVDIIKIHGEKAIPIFRKFGEIMEIFEKKDKILQQLRKNSAATGQKFDETKYYTTITQRGADLLNAIKTKKQGEDFGEFIRDARQYHTDVILYGAQMASIAMTTQNVPLAPEAINNIITNIKVDVVKGGGMIEKMDRSSMKNGENYLYPEEFNEKDYQTVVNNLRTAYQKTDPGWLEYLIDNLARDLNNPKVKFVLLRNRQNGELIGIIKNKPDSEDPGAYYFGTLYVNTEFQKGFGIGEYLQKVAESLIPEEARIVATVSATNPAMERHIDNHDCIGTAIVHEKDSKNSSRELVKLTWRTGQVFVTKNKQYFTREIIKQIAEGKKDIKEVTRGLEIKSSIQIHKLSSTSDNNKKFLEMSNKYFSAGYILTRIFYDRKDGQPDLSNTYAVFEKNETISKSDVQKRDNTDTARTAA